MGKRGNFQSRAEDSGIEKPLNAESAEKCREGSQEKLQSPQEMVCRKMVRANLSTVTF